MSRPKINYSYSIGLQSPVKNLEMMNAYEYAYYRNQALMNAGQSSVLRMKRSRNTVQVRTQSIIRPPTGMRKRSARLPRNNSIT